MQKKIKALAALTLAVVICLCSLYGCGGATSSGRFTSRKMSHHMGEDGITASYGTFDGHRTYTKEFVAGETLEISFSTTSGTLSITVVDPDGTKLLEATEDGTYSCTTTSDGEYSVELVAKDHSGEYQISW